MRLADVIDLPVRDLHAREERENSAGSLCTSLFGNRWQCLNKQTHHPWDWLCLCVLSWYPAEAQSYLSTTFLGGLFLRHLADVTSSESEGREWFLVLDQRCTTIISSFIVLPLGCSSGSQGFQFHISGNWQQHCKGGTKSTHSKTLGEGAAFHISLCPFRFNAAAVFMFCTICLVTKRRKYIARS